MNPSSQKFTSLFDRFEAKTKRIQAKILRNEDLVREGQQELWCRIWQRIQSGESITNANAYMSAAAANVALTVRENFSRNRAISLDSLREDSQDGDPFEPAEDPYESPAISAELKNALRVAVDQLPAKAREATNLFYFGGRTVNQVAVEMGIKPSSVTSHLTHARDALRQLFTLGARKVA